MSAKKKTKLVQALIDGLNEASGAQRALLNYHAKDAAKLSRKSSRQGRKNDKPEKVLEKQILIWAVNHGLSLHVVESKAVYSVAAGQYLRGQAEAGLPDLIGNLAELSVWIELKAKGRRGTLKEHQRDFLIRKVEQGSFASCIDSVDQLSELLSTFLSTAFSDRVRLLLHHLPATRISKNQNHDEKLF